ncbi:MAG: glycine cleavage system protein GcvH [Sulfolobales archaeon]|jgi:glycine cleavage system H protein|nr:glycine cleavage system protein GcvH [Sulfolobales archaeon]MDT7899030.1 glycine cleavage system protein GcvH [Sulfolobales archaeon]MDT7904997.1 glycine cleavage system protein GcvH [Sulfolobales archaeon]
MGEIRVGKYVILDDRLYTETDEWVKLEGNTAIVGVTDYAQKKLRDIVGVQLPETNREVQAGETVAGIESVKAASDVYAPLSGRIVKVNDELTLSPELINQDPYGKGWMFVIEMSKPEEKERLLTPDKYIQTIKQREGL